MTQTRMSMLGKLVHWFTERGARHMSYDDLAQRLRTSGERVSARFGAAADTSANRLAANHIIGIERWGQHRLRTLLGEPLVMDEYDGYRPGEEMTMAALSEAFESTRAGTLQLIDALQQAGVPVTQTAPHNDLGDFSVGGWLYYLDSHATRESIRVRG